MISPAGKKHLVQGRKKEMVTVNLLMVSPDRTLMSLLPCLCFGVELSLTPESLGPLHPFREKTGE